MRLRHILVVATFLTSFAVLPGAAVAQTDVTCADFDAWEWAQLVHDTAATNLPALDPDGDGIACPELPRGVGFAPAIWTDAIPDNVEEAQIVRLIDGDTFEVLLGGVSNRVRIYRADTPETQNELHCGGPEASAFAEYALSFNDTPGVVYLERDVNTRDQYGRELAYVWFTVDGVPYMLNHTLIATGWAEDVDYGDRKYDAQFQTAAAFAEYALSFNDTPGVVYLERDVNTRDQYGRELAYVWFTVDGVPYMLNHLLVATGWAEDVDYGDRKYDAQFQTAAAFAEEYQLGVYTLCGAFEMPGTQPTPTPAPIPPTLTPAPPAQPAPPPPGDCDPSYPTVCIPPIHVTGDLDCGDVSYRRFQVVQPDPHGFDGDHDGVGCESG